MGGRGCRVSNEGRAGGRAPPDLSRSAGVFLFPLSPRAAAAPTGHRPRPSASDTSGRISATGPRWSEAARPTATPPTWAQHAGLAPKKKSLVFISHPR